jgi:glycosyltransferase involved in cell wall biosynthesis
MRILHAINTLDPSYGGPVEGIRNLSHCLVALGHSVSIATLDPPNCTWFDGWSADIIPLGPATHYYKLSFRAFWWLRRRVRDFDVVIINGAWRFSSVGTWLAARSNRVPYVVYSHGMLDPYFKVFRWKELKKRLFWYLLEHRVFRDASAVLFTCDEERARARNRYYPYLVKEAVVRYGVSGQAADANEIRIDAHFPEFAGKRLLLFLGRIHPMKNCATLIRVFSLYEACDPALHLVIAGPDEAGLLIELQRLVRALRLDGRVTFTGPVFGNAKWSLLANAEVFLAPSHMESFGVAMAEALSCGTPVVISDQIGVWRDVKQAKAGFVGTDTVEGFSDAFAQWLSLTSDERQQMRSNALVCFRTSFHASAAAESFLSILREHDIPPSRL